MKSTDGSSHTDTNQVKLRSLHRPVPATVEAAREIDGAGGAIVRLLDAQAGVAPGQACVFYDGERVLGGGWIARQKDQMATHTLQGQGPATPDRLSAAE